MIIIHEGVLDLYEKFLFWGENNYSSIDINAVLSGEYVNMIFYITKICKILHAY